MIASLINRIRGKFLPGSHYRPVGRMDYFLEDLKARGFNCNHILDVGAHRGHWSSMAVKTFPNARITLIEPQVEMEAGLAAFCATHKNCSYVLAGAGPEPGNSALTIWDDLAGSSFLPIEKDELLNRGKQRKVKMITIDQLIGSGEIQRPDLIKLDIQGYELEALNGASQTFGHTEVYILEASLFPFSDLPGLPVLEDTIRYMSERNYALYDFAGFNRRPLDGALGQCDVCFVKKDGFLRRENEWRDNTII